MSNSKKGWVILHKNGWVETDYFHVVGLWTAKGKRVSRERWRQMFRPTCRIVRATLSWDT